MFDPDTPVHPPASSTLIPLLQAESSKACIDRLVTYFNAHRETAYSLKPEPLKRLAAVVVLLFERDGELRVLLTTRSKQLRTHAGQTALPGGRVDAEDASFVHTGLREAHEEVGLPLNSPHIHVLGRLDPGISLHRLIVVPIVALLTDSSILETLVPNEGEVDEIFSHPLEAILDPSIAAKEALAAVGSEHWPYEGCDYYNTNDAVIPVLGNTSYRMHRFRASASPVKGLTADILIKVAEVAYDRPTVYVRYAPDQLKDFASVVEAMNNVQADVGKLTDAVKVATNGSGSYAE